MVNNDITTQTVTPKIWNGKRLIYNDLAKSLGMLLIMWGHIRLNDWSNAFAYAFHIPLFFALSGMVFRKERYANFGEFFKKKIKTLIVPYIIFSFLTWIVWAGFAYLSHQQVDSYWMPLAETFIAQGSGGYLVHNVPLWFVSCLFVMEILFYFMVEIKKFWIAITSVLMAAISYCAINYCTALDCTAIPWNIETAFLGMPFYAAGYLAVAKWGHQGLVDKVNANKIISWIIVAVFAAAVACGGMWNGSISFGHDDLGRNAFVAYGCAFLGVIMILIMCMLIGEWKVKGFAEKIMNSINWFGRNSFNAMVIHNPIKGIMCVVVGGLLHCGTGAVSKNSMYSFIAFVGTLIATIIGIWFINWVKTIVSQKKV